MTASTLAIGHRKPFRTPRRAALSSRLRSLARAITCLVAVAGLSTLWAWRPGSVAPALRGLTVEQREALYQHTRANLELLCEHRRAPGLETYCQEQARLLLHLPECDESCTLIVRDQLGWATR
jgi:hypothetical protein